MQRPRSSAWSGGLQCALLAALAVAVCAAMERTPPAAGPRSAPVGIRDEGLHDRVHTVMARAQTVIENEERILLQEEIERQRLLQEMERARASAAEPAVDEPVSQGSEPRMPRPRKSETAEQRKARHAKEARDFAAWEESIRSSRSKKSASAPPSLYCEHNPKNCEHFRSQFDMFGAWAASRPRTNVKCRKPGLGGKAGGSENAVILELMDSFGGWSHFIPQMADSASSGGCSTNCLVRYYEMPSGNGPVPRDPPSDILLHPLGAPIPEYEQPLPASAADRAAVLAERERWRLHEERRLRAIATRDQWLERRRTVEEQHRQRQQVWEQQQAQIALAKQQQEHFERRKRRLALSASASALADQQQRQGAVSASQPSQPLANSPGRAKPASAATRPDGRSLLQTQAQAPHSAATSPRHRVPRPLRDRRAASPEDAADPVPVPAAEAVPADDGEPDAAALAAAPAAAVPEDERLADEPPVPAIPANELVAAPGELAAALAAANLGPEPPEAELPLPGGPPRAYAAENQVVAALGTEYDWIAPEQMQFVDILAAHHARSQVPVNYFYGLSERCDAQVAERDATECVLRGGPDLASKRTDAFSAVFISNCNSVPRTSYLQRLMELIPIHSYGPCLHSPDLPQDHGRDQNYGELKQQVVKQYRFFISLENTAVDGYLTEKFYEAFAMDTLLVYWGTPNLEPYLPGARSAINMHDFASPDDLAKLLITLWDNEDLYRSFFDWRQPGRPLRPEFVHAANHNLVNKGGNSFMCHLCEYYAQTFCQEEDADSKTDGKAVAVAAGKSAAKPPRHVHGASQA